MKKPLEIVAYQVKAGAARETVALQLDGECPARDFLLELAANNAKGFQILDGQIQFLCDAPRIQPRETFKLLDASRQLFEFRLRSGIRLYCFLAGEALVLLTNGGKKNTKKEQNADIQRARDTYERFSELIRQGAELTIIDP
ncbi:MAG: type II toxin-antitoxin system RelE/ParE family toxin [Akkermansiaceae bacterium]|nr:type II toxin-antitoxin system RelE/ParE family toxin [Akkermansiaceae bacterium]